MSGIAHFCFDFRTKRVVPYWVTQLLTGHLVAGSSKNSDYTWRFSWLSLPNKRSVMTLFSGPTDIYSHQVRIVLAEKGVSFEIEHVEKGQSASGSD
ncbi:stringent starvation protein A [Escherichia coli]|nr:stringent starvation protein A [Escherichia coli]